MSRLIILLKLLGVAVFYALLARVTLAYLSDNGVVSVVWLPSGLALAALLTGGKRYAYSVFSGVFLASVMAGNVTLGMAAAIATGNTLEALLGAWLLTRDGRFSPGLRSLRDYLRLVILAGCISSLVAALNGSTVLLASGFITAEAYFQNLARWWMGDTLGIILLTPLLLIWRRMPGDWLGLKRLSEAALLLMLTLLAGQIVFLDWFHDSVGMVARGYWIFLLVAWVAIRLGTHGVVAALFVTAVQALLGALQGTGFFANDFARTQLTNYWAYMVILSMVGMMLATYFSERRRAEEELQESNDRLQATLDAVPDLLFEVGLDGRIHNYHSSRTELLAAPPEVFLGKKFSDVLPLDVSDVCMSALSEAHEKGSSIGKQYELQLAHGRFWFELSVSRKLANRNQEPHFIFLVRDITERRQAEEMLKLHKLVIDTAMDGFWRVDVTGNLRGVNEAYAEMSGYATDELLNMHISQLEVNESTAQEVEAHIEKIIAQGFDKFETRHRRKDGQVIDVEVFTRFVPESQSFFGFLRDITERKQSERELRELNEHLEERVEQRTRELIQARQLAESANRIKSEFLANMSHEIRTPMNSILGMANLALSREADTKNRDYLKKIQSSGEHLLGIIDDILDFSRLGAGKLKIDTVDFDLSEVLQNVNNLVAGKAAAKELELVFDTDADSCASLRGDPLRLIQVLVNYADNAVKFTEKGRITIRAKKIEESETSCLVRFEVQDCGIGMSEAEKAKLFQPFQQIDTSSTRQYGGTGLGLAICRQLAEMMQDGKVGVESVLGQGSTFWLSVRFDKAGQPCCAKKGGGADMPPVAISGAHILLAENNLFNQQVATEFLENAGATVCVAQNGKEALDLLTHDRFDCVLMDIQMPVLDGYEATRLIRANPALAGMPVIAMTANVSGEDRERCLAAGMDDFISKPFKPGTFYAVIAKWLTGRVQMACGASAAAAVKATANDSGMIDLAILAELVGGDRLKMREFALKFLASARQDMAEIEAALERKDFAALGALGHHLKSPASMAGATGIADLCQALERLGKNGGSMEQIHGIVSQMRPLLDRIEEQVNKDLGVTLLPCPTPKKYPPGAV